MTPRDKRERLFRQSRPNFRPFEFYDGENYHNDIKILWVAHKKSPFPGLEEGLNESAFAEAILKENSDIFVIEDENEQYTETGPVGVILATGDGWKVEPHALWFPWATKKNILRGAVAFFQWARNTRKIGCVLTSVLPEGKNLYDRVCEYGVLHYVGKVINGDPRGDEYMYSVKGKKR